MTDALTSFFGKPTTLRPFAGQLDAAFQRQLQEAHAGVAAEDCHFYHTLELGNGEVVSGGWDMRGNAHRYLGHVQYRGLRVLEFGPASGYLTFWMEEQGADVTVLDLPPGHPPDLVPLPGIDLEANARSGSVTAEQVRNSWWYAHRRRGSKAKAVYGDIYRLPPDLGRYDVSTFGSILLHLGNPFGAMREAARLTDKAMVVTDVLPPILYGAEGNSFLEFNPGNESSNLVNWWNFSPGAIRKMLVVLGFPQVDFYFFEQAYHARHDPGAPLVKRYMYCAVGQRAAGLVPRLEKSGADLEIDGRLRREVPAIHVDNYNEAHRCWQDAERRLREADARLRAIYGSLAWKLTKPVRWLRRE